MKKILFNKLFFISIILNLFSFTLYTATLTDLTNDLKITNPSSQDLVKTLKDGIELKNTYKAKPQAFFAYEVQLEEFFYHALEMPFDDILDLMNDKKMTEEQVITYIENQNATQSDDTKEFKDLCDHYADFYSSILSTASGNANLSSWKIKADPNPTEDSIDQNKDLLSTNLSILNGNDLMSQLYNVFYKPIKVSTWNYLEKSEIIFADGTNSKINLVSLSGKSDAKIGEIVTGNSTSSSTTYLKNTAKYPELVKSLIDTVMAITEALYKDDPTFYPKSGYYEYEQRWFNQHPIGDNQNPNDFKLMLLTKIKSQT